MHNITDLENVPSPSLLLVPELIDRNISQMLALVDGRPELLRPHVKTHKLGEILKRQIEHGIDKVKCATLAEMEMSAKAGVAEALLAYQPVGPNIKRILQLRRSYPGTQFAAVADNLTIASAISAEVARASESPFILFIDLDSGMHRTGISPGTESLDLIKMINEDPHLRFGGIHAYDGHIHQQNLEERKGAFEESLAAIHAFAASVQDAGIEIPLIVAGGSPTFEMHTKVARESPIPWECSPGTTLLWDAGYSENHPDLPFTPAAGLLTRVISKPQAGHLCLDLGHKSVAGENPITHRVRLDAIPDAIFVGQSEEHLVIATEKADEWNVGDTLIGIPWHICPSLALHREAHLIENDRPSGEVWTIHARDRQITV